MFESLELLTLMVFAAVTVVPVAMAWRHWGNSLVHGGRVDRAAWEMYAAERGHRYTPDLYRPKLRGVHEGVSFEVTATITRARRRRQDYEHATTGIRVTHRAALPPDTTIRRRSWAITLGSLIAGQKAVAIDEDYDDLFWIHTADPETLRALLADPDVKRALLSLFVDLPDASVHDRVILADVPGMTSDLSILTRYLDKVTALATALRTLSPQIDRPSAEPTEGLPPLAALPTAAELPQRTEALYLALRRIGGAASRTSSSVQTSALRLRPLEYTLEVRAVVEGVTRLGLPTGGMMVRGMLERGEWRVELNFPPEDTAIVSALSPGDRVTGLCLVDDLRPAGRTVECTATTPPVLLEA